MKRGCPDHPKTIELAALLKIPRPYAVGLLELLFHFTAQYAPAGDVGRFSDDRIEGALFWAGRWCKPGTLIQAMIAAGWIDHDPVHRLVVHDWAQHADQATARKLEREGRAFSAPARVNSDIKNDSLSSSLASPERAVRAGCAQGDSGSTVLPTSSLHKDNGKMTSLPEPEPSQSHYKDKNPPLPPAAQTAADGPLIDLANRIHKRHLARRCPRKEVAKLLAGILKHPNIENRGTDEELLARIDRNHAAWCLSESWTKEGSQFCPGLDKWLRPDSERYLDEPPPAIVMRKPVGRRDTTQEAIEILKERARVAAAAKVIQ